MTAATDLAINMRVSWGTEAPEDLPLVETLHEGTEYECRMYGPRFLPGEGTSIATAELVVTVKHPELLARLQSATPEETA